MPITPVPADQIVITASHAPQVQEQTAASITVLDRQLIDRLSEPLLSDLIRLTPSAAVDRVKSPRDA